jgi:ABC-2 type transport system permease protein
MSISLRRIGLVAARDYKTSITSRGFLIGLLVMPVLMVLLFVLIPRILNSRTPQVAGDVAVIDSTGKVAAELAQALLPAQIAARRALEATNPPPKAGAVVPATPAGPPIPVLTVTPLSADADVQSTKSWLIQPRDAHPQHLAIVVVQPDAVTRAAGASGFGSYDLYTSSHLDDATETALRDSVRAALVSARLHAQGLDATAIAKVHQVFQPDSVVVAAEGEHSGSRGIARFLPFASGILIFIGVITGGQILMTSTVEEKSNRVIEVLLAAVSPLELMYGKLLGQLGLGLTITAVYLLMGVYALGQLSIAGLLDPMLIVYVLAFYIFTFLVFGSLMLTIGSAVNQMADAQSLLGPMMILLVAGYALTPMIGLAPNSSFSVTMSFLPFINTFAMMARVASSAPPPAWQVCMSMLVSCVTAAIVVWFAAKVFKIALLMHGKPPSIGTLIKWARMA